MKATIGSRLAMARESASQIGALREQLCRSCWSRTSSLRPIIETHIAVETGEAAGHAFRAAELAYDLGQAHGRMTREAKVGRRGTATIDSGKVTSITEGYRLFATYANGDHREVKVGETFGPDVTHFQMAAPAGGNGVFFVPGKEP